MPASTSTGSRLRPVLVYGEGMKGNMAALLALSRSPWPLPFGAIRARRSLLSADSLALAVDAVLRAPAPLRRPLIAAEPEPLAVPDIVASFRAGLKRRAGLVPVPPGLLALAGRLAGREHLVERIAGDLVASSDALTRFGWQPAAATREALARLAGSSPAAA